MYISNPEILLALRAPDSAWLGVLATVLDEATRDPSFDARQREILAQLLTQERVPTAVSDAARRRAARFEAELASEEAMPPAPMRHEMQAGMRADAQGPKLTLVGNVGG